MTKFIDIKTLDYIEKANFKNRSFEEWLEEVKDYQVSDSGEIRAIEKVHFALERASEDRVAGTERALDMDQKLLIVLAEMEHRGVYVEKSLLADISEELAVKAKALEIEMRELVGESFNPLSAKQVQYILYDRLKIPAGKKIKTGFSVDSETLEEIGKTYEIANMILAYRGYEKLRSTYAEGLQKEINHVTKRIHTTYRETVASTGRLSSENPNLQNIPMGSGFAAQIKSAFRPQESDWTFVVADYSQVELRILAMLSGDEHLTEAFEIGEDIHMRTARFLFPTSETISSEQRRIAKSVNFGVIYGITGFGLSKMIKASPKEATLYIDTFFAKYPQVKAYYRDLLDNARLSGYVETYFGRRRYIKGLTDANSMMRAGAEREAMNMPIQGTGADVVKLAMIEITKRLKDSPHLGHLIMQVHDELVFECPKAHAAELESIVREVMEGVFLHPRVKLKVDIHSGDDWSSAKG